jgi:menaquinone-dependent protoporphyrinogen oxidase
MRTNVDGMALTIAIVYASWHGHVRAIAEHLAGVGALCGAQCALYDVTEGVPEDIASYDAVLITGSVHFARFAAPLRRFVERRRALLSEVPSAFLSVSGSAAALDGRAKAEEAVAEFLRVTGWKPDLTECVGGAVLYTKYDPITRLAMRFASRIAGRDADTSRDYDYTNWANVDAFMHLFVEIVERHTRAAAERRSLDSRIQTVGTHR